MSNAWNIVQRLLEDEPPLGPEQLDPAPDEEEDEGDIRDLFFRQPKPSGKFESPGSSTDPQRRYRDLLAKLGRRTKRKLTNNTYLELRDDGGVAVRFHDTDIVSLRPDGAAIITTGGWPTVTTRARINDYLTGGWQLFSEPYPKHGEEAPEVYWTFRDYQGQERSNLIKRIGKYFWYNRGTEQGTFASGEYLPFTDGDRIKPDGTLVMQTAPTPRKPSRARHHWP